MCKPGPSPSELFRNSTCQLLLWQQLQMLDLPQSMQKLADRPAEQTHECLLTGKEHLEERQCQVQTVTNLQPGICHNILWPVGTQRGKTLAITQRKAGSAGVSAHQYSMMLTQLRAIMMVCIGKSPNQTWKRSSQGQGWSTGVSQRVQANITGAEAHCLAPASLMQSRLAASPLQGTTHLQIGGAGAHAKIPQQQRGDNHAQNGPQAQTCLQSYGRTGHPEHGVVQVLQASSGCPLIVHTQQQEDQEQKDVTCPAAAADAQ